MFSAEQADTNSIANIAKVDFVVLLSALNCGDISYLQNSMNNVFFFNSILLSVLWVLV